MIDVPCWLKVMHCGFERPVSESACLLGKAGNEDPQRLCHHPHSTVICPVLIRERRQRLISKAFLAQPWRLKCGGCLPGGLNWRCRRWCASRSRHAVLSGCLRSILGILLFNNGEDRLVLHGCATVIGDGGSQRAVRQLLLRISFRLSPPCFPRCPLNKLTSLR